MICDESRRLNVRNEGVNVNGVKATKRNKSGKRERRAANRKCSDLVYQTADKKNCCVLPHKKFISSVSFNALHYVYVLHAISTVCLPVPSVGHRQSGLFHYVPTFSDPSVMCSKDRKTDLFHCPVCLFQMVHFQGPVCVSHLPVPYVRHRRDRQTGHFHCPVCPICLVMF